MLFIDRVAGVGGGQWLRNQGAREDSSQPASKQAIGEEHTQRVCDTTFYC